MGQTSVSDRKKTSGDGRQADFELSLVIPLARGEGLSALLTAVRLFLRDYARGAELVLVDDGCETPIEPVAMRWRSQFSGLSVARHETRKGRGAAARTGVLAARGEYIVVIDPELQIPLVNATLLLECLRDGADAAVISRRMPGDEHLDERPFLERAAETTVMTLSQLMVPIGVKDSLSGLRGFRARAAKKIAQRSRVSSAAFGIEWLALAEYLGFQVVECPIRWVRGPLLGSRGRERAPLSLVGDVWKTRKRLKGAEYVDSVHSSELLHETSFTRLDRDALLKATKTAG